MNNIKMTALALIALSSGLSLQSCHNSETNDAKTTTTVAADSTLDTVSDVAKDKATKLTPEETDFVQKAAVGGMMEVDAANLALQKTKNPKIKEFAQLMLADHTKANDELKSIATQKGLALPASYPVAEKAHMDQMKALKEDGFDRHYIKMMVDDHVKTLDLFRKAKLFGDPELKAFATKTLPTLEGHYRKADAISQAFDKLNTNNGDDPNGISPTRNLDKK
ncbi:DUF4142 domain-containing protein [Pedobacter duraquae]|nr:DUF4142 domain-containing protein [Pedobacter duraquae]